LLLDSLVLKQVDVTSILADDLQFLLLEDVDLLMSDHAGELALFNLFNYCKNNSIKLVVSSLVHPKDNAWQLPDLISRLNSGLTYALEPLNGSDAMTCIAKQFSLNGMTLDKTVIHYLQTHYSSSYPALFRLFLSVSTQSLKLKRKVTVPLIKQAIKDSES
ncbi:MAG: HdaA/DnaA family protein, partial [Marinicella sp.]